MCMCVYICRGACLYKHLLRISSVTTAAVAAVDALVTLGSSVWKSCIVFRSPGFQAAFSRDFNGNSLRIVCKTIYVKSFI